MSDLPTNHTIEWAEVGENAMMGRGDVTQRRRDLLANADILSELL